MRNGYYIVLEGPEGVGKSTQVMLLAGRLKQAGHSVRIFREPDSHSDLTARAIRSITQDPHYPMNTRTEVLLYNAARSQSLEVIKTARTHGVTCIVDRNYLTTLANQYYGRGDVPDYQAINAIIDFAVGDMQPDATVILDAPANVLFERAKKRGGGERFDNLDLSYLERVRAGYLWEAKQRGYPVVFANNAEAKVHEAIWQTLQGTIAPGSPDASQVTISFSHQTMEASAEPPITAAVAVQSGKPAPAAPADSPAAPVATAVQPTPQTPSPLSTLVTSPAGDVYAFTPALSQSAVAAALTQLSRSRQDLRLSTIQELADHTDDERIRETLMADDSGTMQRMSGIHLVIENASDLLVKKLEWCRTAVYAEQSIRYVHFNQNDENGRFRYYVPSGLPKKLRARYCEILDLIFELHTVLVRELTRYLTNTSTVPKNERNLDFRLNIKAQASDAVRHVLPVAAKSSVGVFASSHVLQALITHLMADDMAEANAVGEKLLAEARKVMPAFLEAVDRPERGGATAAYHAATNAAMKRFADTALPQTNSLDHESVRLASYYPRNELELLPYMLYQYSGLSVHEIERAVQTWSFDQKLATFRTYIGDRHSRLQVPGRALEHAQYTFDVVGEYGMFRDLQRYRLLNGVEWQALTPRYGFDIPDSVVNAGLSEQFERCFELSAVLYSELQATTFELEAQYATLIGHRMRWTVSLNAREALRLHEYYLDPRKSADYRSFVQKMHDKVAEVHPLLAESMKFVNQNEQPDSSRRGAEQYAQLQKTRQASQARFKQGRTDPKQSRQS